MRATQPVVAALVFIMLGLPAGALGQAPAPHTAAANNAAARPAAQNAPTAADDAATWTAEEQKTRLMLEQDPDIQDAMLHDQVKKAWITASCNLKVLALPATLMHDARFVEGYLAACSERMAKEPDPVADAASQGQAGAAHSPAPAHAAATPPPAPNHAGAPTTPTASVPPPKAPQPAADAKPEDAKPVADAARKPADAAARPVGGADDAGADAAAAAATCPKEPYYGNRDDEKPTLDKVDLPLTTTKAITGKISKSATGKVQLCLDGSALGDAAMVNEGAFSVTLATADAGKVTNGKKIQAQLTDANGELGPPSEDLLVGSCSLDAKGTDPATALTVTKDAKNNATYSGTVKGSSEGVVRICVNDVPLDGNVATIGAGGKFKGGKTFPLAANDKIVAQECAKSGTACGSDYGPLSNTVQVSSQLAIGNTVDANKPVAILIGGVEYAGYSSEAQTTDGFLDIFYRGPVTKGWSGWGRVRLTSAAQPSTNGVVSLISNPSGLSSFDYSNVGQVLDYVAGPSWNIPNSQHWALIAGVGAITPLSSQSVPISFMDPPLGSLECATLISRFSLKNGYNPGVTANPIQNPSMVPAGGPSTCLVNAASPTTGITDISFANQDRSNFLLKYGGGFRTWYPFGGCASGTSSGSCSTAYAALDASLGQDASITGGLLRGVVFKMDGLLPIPTGDASWLYLFGSTYIRLTRNHNFDPLILQSAAAATVTIPSPTVDVLPLKQPNRDYYRLGVGININQLWCKALSPSSCAKSATNGGSDDAVPTVTGVTPKTGSAGSSQPITVAGTNFTTNSYVVWNGTKLVSSKYVSSTSMTATVTPDLMTKGTAKITVSNPAPSGGGGPTVSTTSATFTVN